MENNFYKELFLFNSGGYSRPKCGGAHPLLAYQLMCDYYSSKNDIVVKNHPQSRADEYKKHFVSSQIQHIEASLPMDMFLLLDNFQIDRCVSVNTTSTKRLKDNIL